jgi:hypothetical protein
VQGHDYAINYAKASLIEESFVRQCSNTLLEGLVCEVEGAAFTPDSYRVCVDAWVGHLQ